MMTNGNGKSLESWIWDAACSIRGAQEAPKFKDFILPLIFTKRLCDVFDDELNRIAEQVGSRAKAFRIVEKDHKLVRFYLPLKPADPNDAVWSVIRKLTGKIGESLTTYLHDIAKANPALEGIIDRMDFNATTHGQRDIDDDRLSNLIERVSEKRLGLKDVEADIIGRSYEYLIRKFAEGSGQSAGEFFTPPEVARVMAAIMDPDPGMSVYDPCCGSAGLLIACEHVLDDKMKLRSKTKYAPLRMHGQEYIATTWAMANMNMIIHDMEGQIEIGDTFKNPKFRAGNKTPDVRSRRVQSDVEPGLVQGNRLRRRRTWPLPAGGGISRRAVGRLGLGPAHPRVAQCQGPRRDRPRHRCRIQRQRQRQ
jgi:type I restriction enzyme M protein